MPPPDPKTQSSEELVAFLNSRLDVPKTNPAVYFLRGKIESYNETTGVITMRYTTHDQLSNGANVVQGGFTAAMLDAAFAVLTMVQTKLDKVISTLEQKQSYFRPVPLNVNVICKAWCVRQGKDLAFFESELRSESSNELLAKASQTAMLVPVVRKTSKPKL